MTKMSKFFAVALSLSLLALSCKKEDNDPQTLNIEQKDTSYIVDLTAKGDTAYNMDITKKDTIKVNYSLIVLSADKSMMKSTSGLDGATVIVTGNGTSVTATTDANGMVNFKNLPSGQINVVVKKTDYSTANLVVELGTNAGTEKIRSASSIISLFNTSATAMKTISGKAYADLNVTITTESWSKFNNGLTENNTLEFVPNGTKIYATVTQNALLSYVSTTGDGAITKVAYEMNQFEATVGANGSYSISVPFSQKGLEFDITPAEFQSNITYSAKVLKTDGSTDEDLVTGNMKFVTKTEEHLFEANTLSVTVKGNVIKNITYSFYGSIADPLYYGTIY